MNVERYRQLQKLRLQAEWQPRVHCELCKKPPLTCYCANVKAFAPATQFVILIHRHENRRSIATGRMAHLCLSNSHFYEGTDFTEHAQVNAILQNPKNFPVVLYPNADAVDLSEVDRADRQSFVPDGKQLVVFIIDGTWAQAKRMRRLSRNLHDLPHLYFTPETPSRFRVRKQPQSDCYSTIEAIHHFIELVEDTSHQKHQNLMEVFSVMVERQIDFEKRLAVTRRGSRYEARKRNRNSS